MSEQLMTKAEYDEVCDLIGAMTDTLMEGPKFGWDTLSHDRKAKILTLWAKLEILLPRVETCPFADESDKEAARYHMKNKQWLSQLTESLGEKADA